MPVVKTSISVEPELLRRLKQLAEREGSSVSELFQRFALQCLDDAERTAHLRKDSLTEALLAEILRPENLERAAKLVGEAAAESDVLRKRAESLAAASKPTKGRK